MEDAAIQAARQLADRSPEGEVACPVCANTMPGASLAKHLGAKHAGVSELPTRWDGYDVATQSVALWLALAAVVLGIAGIALTPPAFDRFVVGVALMPLLLSIGLLMASFAEKLPGSLELKGDELELVTLLGLRTRRLRLPPEGIEVGQLRIWTESPVGGVNHVERMMGKYLRLTGDGDTLILGAPKGTNMAKRWNREHFTNGPKRQYWHLNLDREALVHLEYHLAARGALD